MTPSFSNYTDEVASASRVATDAFRHLQTWPRTRSRPEADRKELPINNLSAPPLDSVLDSAVESFQNTSKTTPVQRADWLTRIADTLDADAGEAIAIAHRETHLPEHRLSSELARTTFQARLHAERLRTGELFETRIDHADPHWPMGPRPDLRLTTVPIGPVLVYAASNFPFAFSVLGGDTVSAIAAGCSVVVKVHPGHPELSRRVAATATSALETTDAPRHLLTLIEGEDAGVAAVRDRRIKAVGFTGSTRGGRFLYDLAVSRPDPIPFYGELGATNPVIVTPRGWEDRAGDIVAGFAASFTQGAGQFCTKPGVVFVPDADGFLRHLEPPTVHAMLNQRIREGYEEATADVASSPGVTTITFHDATHETPAVKLLRTAAATVLEQPDILHAEMFGPAALLVEYQTTAQLFETLALYEGSLTGTIQAGSDVDQDSKDILHALAGHVGRVVWNQWPTGVSVSDAQNHGGPWPSSTAPLATSVGTAAVRRFLRPVAFQNVPIDALPHELR